MLIDPAIRDWVMIPLLALVVLSVYVRMYASRLLADPKPVDKDELAQRNMVARSQRLRANCGYISYPAFLMRKEYLAGEGGGKFKQEIKAKAAAAQNPMQQMDMLKQQFVMMGTQVGLGMFTQAFTSGFVALQLPFRLTERFKSMTQAGVGVSALDTTYVSSSSWYMINAFGLPRVMQLFSKGAAVDEAKMMQMQMGMGMMGGGGGQQPPWQGKQAYTNEASALGILEWSPAPLLVAEKELLAEAKELSKQRSSSNSSSSNKKTQ